MPIPCPLSHAVYGHVTHPSQHPALLADDDAGRLGADEQRHGDLPGGLLALGALRLHHAAMHQLLARWGTMGWGANFKGCAG